MHNSTSISNSRCICSKVIFAWVGLIAVWRKLVFCIHKGFISLRCQKQFLPPSKSSWPVTSLWMIHHDLVRTNGCCAQDKISGDDEEVGSDGEVGEVRMLFPSLALFSHSCSPNTQVEKKTGSEHKKSSISYQCQKRGSLLLILLDEALHQPDYGIAISSTKPILKAQLRFEHFCLHKLFSNIWASEIISDNALLEAIVTRQPRSYQTSRYTLPFKEIRSAHLTLVAVCCMYSWEFSEKEEKDIYMRVSHFWVVKGEEITITYTSLLGSSEARRRDIQTNWFFDCHCQRCLSQDDFGSNTDSWKCDVNSCDGWIKPAANERICCNCKAETEKSVMNGKENILEEKLMKIISNSASESHIQNIQSFIQDQQILLHPNHWIMTLARISLVNKEVQNGSSKADSDLVIDNCKWVDYRVRGSIINIVNFISQLPHQPVGQSKAGRHFCERILQIPDEFADPE